MKKTITKTMKKFEFWLLSLSTVGLIAAFWQTAEKIHYLKNPDVALSCNLNPIVDCGTVLSHSLSSVFGVANSLIGIIAFTFLAAAGVFLLMGARFNIVIKRLIVAIAAIMFMFSVWFFGVSLYEIGKICIFCVFIWTATIPLFLSVVRQYDEVIFTNKTFLSPVRNYINNRLGYSIALVYIIGIGMFLFRFREYYFN